MAAREGRGGCRAGQSDRASARRSNCSATRAGARTPSSGSCSACPGMIGLWGIGFFSPELISTALRGEPQAVVDRVRGLGTALQDVGSFFGMVTFTLIAAFLSRRLAFLGALLLSMAVTDVRVHVAPLGQRRLLDAADDGLRAAGRLRRAIRSTFRSCSRRGCAERAWASATTPCAIWPRRRRSSSAISRRVMSFRTAAVLMSTRLSDRDRRADLGAGNEGEAAPRRLRLVGPRAHVVTSLRRRVWRRIQLPGLPAAVFAATRSRQFDMYSMLLRAMVSGSGE